MIQHGRNGLSTGGVTVASVQAPGTVLVIAGPTASGKSGLAIDLALRLGGRIINADSMQVYRDLAVLTARPGPAEMARAPHALYGVLDGANPCSAADWASLARDEIRATLDQGLVPILCGGTGLYLRALLDGIAAVPPIPVEIREAGRRRHAAIGGAEFRAELAELDPESAARLNEGDGQRLMRAWEVVMGTGRTLGYWQCQGRGMALGLPFRAVTLLPPRDALYAAIERRFQRMLDEGALEEVALLFRRRLDPALPVMKAVGVPELIRHLLGEIALADAVTQAQQATRRYAKRQYTWFRHQFPEATPIFEQYSERNAGQLCQKICNSA